MKQDGKLFILINNSAVNSFIFIAAVLKNVFFKTRTGNKEENFLLYCASILFKKFTTFSQVND